MTYLFNAFSASSQLTIFPEMIAVSMALFSYICSRSTVQLIGGLLWMRQQLSPYLHAPILQKKGQLTLSISVPQTLESLSAIWIIQKIIRETMTLILIKASHYIMASQTQNTEDKRTLPQLRTNKHFRIKSSSKDKFVYPKEAMSVRTRHKDTAEEPKRIFSESRNRKSGSMDTSIKIKIAKEQLQSKFQKVKKDSNKRKPILYEEVKTQTSGEQDENRFTGRVRTFHHDDNHQTLQKMGKVSDPNQIIRHLHLDESDPKILKKHKEDRELKESKGKYRCRVNQFVFDHTRKKSSFGKKEEQETIDEFWKNVNESMILASRQEEEMSKDLREFVENFKTE